MIGITPGRTRNLLIAAFFVLSFPTYFASAQGSGNGSELPPAQVERIIKSFTAKEGEFRRALNEYSFKRDALLQSLGMGGQVTGEYHRVSTFTFDDSGTRYEKINYFPMPSFANITQEDIDDLGGVSPLDRKSVV